MSDYTQKKTMTIKSFCWCEGCGCRTDHTKIGDDVWKCEYCWTLLDRTGHVIREHKPQEAERVAATCPA